MARENGKEKKVNEEEGEKGKISKGVTKGEIEKENERKNEKEKIGIKEGRR